MFCTRWSEHLQYQHTQTPKNQIYLTKHTKGERKLIPNLRGEMKQYPKHRITNIVSRVGMYSISEKCNIQRNLKQQGSCTSNQACYQ